MSAVIAGIDPRTGITLAPVAEPSTAVGVDRMAVAAAAAAPQLHRQGRRSRAGLLAAIADAIEMRRAELIDIASLETGFAEAKLGAELTRAVFQFRFFADVLRDGGYLEAAIDPAGDTPMGPRPDLRRILVPIGPVAVFGASNFPFAFSVLGGDTASAVAAGSPVLLKAHGSHPGTSALSFNILCAAAASASAPEATFSMIWGTQGGVHLVEHPTIKAVGFTGSLSGGKALIEVINRREEPIPFYGELSSINPVIVTPAAAAERAEDIAAGLIASITVGSGQLCTKPGLILVPVGADGNRLTEAARARIAGAAPQILLNERVYTDYTVDTAALAAHPALTVTTGECYGQQGFTVAPALFETTVDDLSAGLIDESSGRSRSSCATTPPTSSPTSGGHWTTSNPP